MSHVFFKLLNFRLNTVLKKYLSGISSFVLMVFHVALLVLVKLWNMLKLFEVGRRRGGNGNQSDCWIQEELGAFLRRCGAVWWYRSWAPTKSTKHKKTQNQTGTVGVVKSSSALAIPSCAQIISPIEWMTVLLPYYHSGGGTVSCVWLFHEKVKRRRNTSWTCYCMQSKVHMCTHWIDCDIRVGFTIWQRLLPMSWYLYITEGFVFVPFVFYFSSSPNEYHIVHSVNLCCVKVVREMVY